MRIASPKLSVVHVLLSQNKNEQFPALSSSRRLVVGQFLLNPEVASVCTWCRDKRFVLVTLFQISITLLKLIFSKYICFRQLRSMYSILTCLNNNVKLYKTHFYSQKPLFLQPGSNLQLHLSLFPNPCALSQVTISIVLGSFKQY